MSSIPQLRSHTRSQNFMTRHPEPGSSSLHKSISMHGHFLCSLLGTWCNGRCAIARMAHHTLQGRGGVRQDITHDAP